MCLGPVRLQGPSNRAIACPFLSYACSPFYVEVALTSLSQSSQISLDTLSNHNRLPIDLPATSDQIGHDLPLGDHIASSQARIEHPSESLPIPRNLTIHVAPPPGAVPRSILHFDAQGPIPSAPVIITWPNHETRWQDSPLGYPGE
jgi:hypothetical protein